jgi:hypothetical protein
MMIKTSRCGVSGLRGCVQLKSLEYHHHRRRRRRRRRHEGTGSMGDVCEEKKINWKRQFFQKFQQRTSIFVSV